MGKIEKAIEISYYIKTKDVQGAHDTGGITENK